MLTTTTLSEPAEAIIFCDEPNCTNEGFPCFYPPLVEDEPPFAGRYCPEHANTHGFCRCCGCFGAGMESFDFIHPGLCDECDLQLRVDDGEFDDPTAEEEGDDWGDYDDMMIEVQP